MESSKVKRQRAVLKQEIILFKSLLNEHAQNSRISQFHHLKMTQIQKVACGELIMRLSILQQAES